MIIRLNLWKISKNLCKFHTNLMQRNLLVFRENGLKSNKYLINCYSNKNKFWSEFDFIKYNNNNNNENNNEFIPKDIYKFQDSYDSTQGSKPSSASLDSTLSADEMQTHSQNLLNFSLNNSYSNSNENNGNNSNNNNNRNDWFDVLSKAEQVVKYPTSFLSLRFLLKDEISYLAIHLKRLIDTKHPLLQTAKTIMSTNQQIRGLVVLLVSKAHSYPKHILDNYDSETNRLAIINKSQRKLAELTDMVHVSQVLHRGVIDLPLRDGIDSTLNEDLHLGNTISVLIGDFLLAQSSRALALIRNPTITGWIATAIGHYSEAEFLRTELLKTQISSESIEKYCYLSGGSLLAHSCKSSLLLAQYDQHIQCQAFDIGKHIGIAFQLSDLLSKPTIADNKSYNNCDDNCHTIDTNLVQYLLKSNVKKAIDLIKTLDNCEASIALTDIVLNIEKNQNINEFN